MLYRNSDPMAISAMERARTGNYGEDYYSGEERNVYCCACDCDIDYTKSRKVYSFSSEPFCEDCFREVLFEALADEYATPLDKWEDD